MVATGVLRFGKYRGMSHLEIAFTDRNYAIWLSSWPHLRDYDRRELEKAIAICRMEEPAAIRQMIEQAKQRRRPTVEIAADELPDLELPEITTPAAA